MTEYDVEDMDDLDNFNGMDAWAEVGVDFCVNVVSAREVFYPVFTIRENGDVDGFEGWK